MKKRFVLPAALALLLALCGCGGAAETSAPPSPEPSPSLAAEPSPALTAEELLARQVIDDDHDAFLVPTGGRLGTLLVTAEIGEELPDRSNPLTLSVWDTADLTKPIQEISSETFDVSHHPHIVDANFDGYMDFGYMYAMGNQPCYSHYWIWNEEQGQFVAEPEFDKISCPQFDPETGIIDGWARSSAAGDGVTTFHRWEEGKLVCVRRIELELTDWSEDDSLWLLTVQDRVNGELKEIFRMECPWDSNDCWDEREKWSDLDYHGEGPDLRELLARQVIDEDHNAFLVPTGGRLGTLLVTVERGELTVIEDRAYSPVVLTVWDPQDMDAPLQTMEAKLWGPYALISRSEDANFDGYMDFEFLCNQYVRAQAFDLWLWDEDAGQFVEEPAFAQVLNPSLDPETRTVGGIVRVTWDVDQLTEYHWEDGRLVCDRMVEYLSPNPDEGQEEGEMVVYELVDGELTEVSREPFDPMESG